jgi:hypothetical protein
MPQLRSGARPQRQAALEAKARLGGGGETSNRANRGRTRAATGTVSPPIRGRAAGQYNSSPKHTKGAGATGKAGEGDGEKELAPTEAVEEMKAREEGQTDKEKQTNDKAKEEEASTAPLPEKVGNTFHFGLHHLSQFLPMDTRFKSVAPRSTLSSANSAKEALGRSTSAGESRRPSTRRALMPTTCVMLLLPACVAGKC